MEDKLDNVLAIDRIKKLQGKEVVENSKEYLADKKKTDEDNLEKDALIKKYVTTPKEVPEIKTKSTGLTKGKVFLMIFIVASFFVGTAYGVYVINAPANNSSKSNVNTSAFPTNNTTNATNATNLTTNGTQATTTSNLTTTDTNSNYNTGYDTKATTTTTKATTKTDTNSNTGSTGTTTGTKTNSGSTGTNSGTTKNTSNGT